ncbi:MAG TPA: dephospho-CoA kinase [Gemmatales bacterium]|nr:dephospho-CoA kinase [Gemmatales bacterium]
MNTLQDHAGTLAKSLPSQSIPVLGLVGGIGSGKSYISHMFAQLGAVVVDADRIGHEVLLRPEIVQAIRDVWGDAVLEPSSGTLPVISRKQLGKMVFSDPAAKARLEAIVHPSIHQTILKQIAEAAENPANRLVILDAAILLETGWKNACQAVIFVEASEETRLKRVASRGWDTEELHRREASQWPLEKKKLLAQHILPNEDDELYTEGLVKDLFFRYARK